MSLVILEAGVLDTVQDLGRYGQSDSGINVGGAMDFVAASVANYLVGNIENEAVIEMHFPAVTIQFNKAAFVAISGADFTCEVNDQPIFINTPVVIPAKSVLRFTKCKKGARAYLAIAGGLELPKWLNSYSTNLKAKAGGFKGNRLQKGDEIILQRSHDNVGEVRPLPFHADVSAFYKAGIELRIIKGSEYNLLTDCSESILNNNTFTISSQSDRMGYRMNGSPLQLKHQKQMISAAVTNGTIQLLPNGQVIILMADHQTTGGYPKIAHIITADIPKLAQMNINAAISFKMITLEEAEDALLQQHHHLQQLKNACNFRLHNVIQHGIN